ncbi:MAG TPA: hypothetical protein VG839_09420 [Asticcacaulis sp.]|nr:hypothetical protein [Asticcacaulis sp.]
MPRPASPLDLVYSPSSMFPTNFSNWKEALRTHRYFRVFGYNHHRRAAGLFDHSQVENKTIVAEAKKIIQDSWEKHHELPPTHSNKDGLELAGVGQVQNVRMEKLVSFQSACLAIVALELAIQKGGKNKRDIYGASKDDPNGIRILPVLFVVDNYDQAFYETKIKRDPATYAKLKKSTGQHRLNGRHGSDVFQEMAAGDLVTERLTLNFVSFWKSQLASYSLCEPRMGNGFRKASAAENEDFPLVEIQAALKK